MEVSPIGKILPYNILPVHMLHSSNSQSAHESDVNVTLLSPEEINKTDSVKKHIFTKIEL